MLVNLVEDGEETCFLLCLKFFLSTKAMSCVWNLPRQPNAATNGHSLFVSALLVLFSGGRRSEGEALCHLFWWLKAMTSITWAWKQAVVVLHQAAEWHAFQNQSWLETHLGLAGLHGFHCNSQLQFATGIKCEGQVHHRAQTRMGLDEGCVPGVTAAGRQRAVPRGQTASHTKHLDYSLLLLLHFCLSFPWPFSLVHEVPAESRWMRMDVAVSWSPVLQALSAQEGCGCVLNVTEHGQEGARRSAAGKEAGHTITDMITTNLCDENKQSHVCWVSALSCQFFLNHQLLKRAVEMCKDITFTDCLQVWQLSFLLLYLWGWLEVPLAFPLLLEWVHDQNSDWMVRSRTLSFMSNFWVSDVILDSFLAFGQWVAPWEDVRATCAMDLDPAVASRFSAGWRII